MNEWPDEWFRPDPARRTDPGEDAQGGAAPAGPGMAAGQGGAGSAWPQQPPRHSLGGGPAAGSLGGQPRAGGAGPGLTQAPAAPRPPAGPPPGGPQGPGGPRGPRARRRLRPRWIIAIIAGLLALILIFVAGMYFFLNSRLDRRNILVSYPGRPAASAGTNWLITGSDSRQGLTRRQERRFSTGFDVGGHRSDTVMVLHVPGNGGPSVLVSLPRDSYVDIPGYGYNKLNAAYALGGPRLLARTVQNITGLRIDHYMGIGFGGLVRVVDAVGGVRMCIRYPINDWRSGLHLRKGCQTLDGAQALGYVRDRHSFGISDLQRVQDQRLFLKALLTRLTSPGVIANPFSSIAAAIGASGTLTVDQGTSLYQLIHVALALRHPETTTVPIANPNVLTSAGDSVIWNTAQARRLFSDLKHDRAVPKYLITGSRQSPQTG